MKFRSTIPAGELAAFKNQLTDAGFPAEIEYAEEFVYLRSTEEGEAWLRAEMAKEEPVKPNVHDEEADKRESLKFVKVLMIGFLLIAGYSVYAMATAPEPVATEVDELRQDFGEYSEWGQDFQQMINSKYVNNPRTVELEGWRLFPNGDSVTVVYLFSAENAFGVRADHSSTASVSKYGGKGRILNVQ